MRISNLASWDSPVVKKESSQCASTPDKMTFDDDKNSFSPPRPRKG